MSPIILINSKVTFAALVIYRGSNGLVTQSLIHQAKYKLELGFRWTQWLSLAVDCATGPVVFVIILFYCGA